MNMPRVTERLMFACRRLAAHLRTSRAEHRYTVECAAEFRQERDEAQARVRELTKQVADLQDGLDVLESERQGLGVRVVVFDALAQQRLEDLLKSYTSPSLCGSETDDASSFEHREEWRRLLKACQSLYRAWDRARDTVERQEKMIKILDAVLRRRDRGETS